MTISLSLQIAKATSALLSSTARKAVFYAAPDLVVKATHRHKPMKNSSRTEVLVTFGKPAWDEKLFIKACRKAVEGFPVKKVQLKPWPKKRK